MYDQIYMNPDSNNGHNEKNKEAKATFKDILAMTIAAYQIIFIPFSIFVLVLIIFFLLFKLIFAS